MDDDSRAYWEGARRRELLILRCRQCGFYVHYPKARCTRCGSGDVTPQRVSGRGTVHSYTITHHKAPPGFEDKVPFGVALVELEEQAGLRVIAHVVDCPPKELRIGMPVEAVYEDVAPDVTLPQFRSRERRRPQAPATTKAD